MEPKYDRISEAADDSDDAGHQEHLLGTRPSSPSDAPRRPGLPTIRKASLGLSVLVFGLACFLSGLLLGSRSSGAETNTWRLADGTSIPTIQKRFVRNTTFIHPPSAKLGTEAAWDSLIPHGQGFVTYEADPDAPAPLISAIHQLHCLYTVRRSYFALTGDAALPGNETAQHKPVHVAHCFDYLRQAITCAADPVVEYATTAKGEARVSGWDSVHTCRDYAALARWAEAWAARDRRGFREGVYPPEDFEMYPGLSPPRPPPPPLEREQERQQERQRQQEAEVEGTAG